MYKNKNIIVSMTSYPGRINNVSKSIFALLKQQTLPPDEIHLWLSIEEFPNKEKDLPAELQMVLNHSKVTLHWLEKNTYVHKRHEYFKNADENDCVFLIDDDVLYNNTLIKTVMEQHLKTPDSIICYNAYELHRYNGKKILYVKHTLGPGPHINKVRWCGQCMIPAKIYPKIILSESYQKIRNESSPISDECWFQPWVVFYNIPVYYFNFGWGTDIDPNNGKNKGICRLTHVRDSDGYTKRDYWLNNTLTNFPELYKKYNELFGYKS